jgi:hypothetical protein
MLNEILEYKPERKLKVALIIIVIILIASWIGFVVMTIFTVKDTVVEEAHYYKVPEECLAALRNGGDCQISVKIK